MPRILKKIEADEIASRDKLVPPFDHEFDIRYLDYYYGARVRFPLLEKSLDSQEADRRRDRGIEGGSRRSDYIVSRDGAERWPNTGGHYTREN